MTGAGGHVKRVSKRITEVAAIAVVVAAILVQPVLASTRTDTGGNLRSIIRQIIRALDTIQIGFPPG
jgi:hypothetical protein